MLQKQRFRSFARLALTNEALDEDGVEEYGQIEVAPLTQEGFSEVTSECCFESFDKYSREVLQQEGFEICDEGCFNGFIAFFHCGQTEYLEQFIEQIWQNSNSECPCFARLGECNVAGLSDKCLEQGEYNPSWHRRRNCGGSTSTTQSTTTASTIFSTTSISSTTQSTTTSSATATTISSTTTTTSPTTSSTTQSTTSSTESTTTSSTTQLSTSPTTSSTTQSTTTSSSKSTTTSISTTSPIISSTTLSTTTSSTQSTTSTSSTTTSLTTSSTTQSTTTSSTLSTTTSISSTTQSTTTSSTTSTTTSSTTTTSPTTSSTTQSTTSSTESTTTTTSSTESTTTSSITSTTSLTTSSTTQSTTTSATISTTTSTSSTTQSTTTSSTTSTTTSSTITTTSPTTSSATTTTPTTTAATSTTTAISKTSTIATTTSTTAITTTTTQMVCAAVPRDIMIAIDASKSVKTAWPGQVEFATNLIGEIMAGGNPNGHQINLQRFHKDTRPIGQPGEVNTVGAFSSDYSPVVAALGALDYEVVKDGGTDHPQVFMTADEAFQSSVAGARPGVEKILVLITDGVTHSGQDCDLLDQAAVEAVIGTCTNNPSHVCNWGTSPDSCLPVTEKKCMCGVYHAVGFKQKGYKLVIVGVVNTGTAEGTPEDFNKVLGEMASVGQFFPIADIEDKAVRDQMLSTLVSDMCQTST